MRHVHFAIMGFLACLAGAGASLLLQGSGAGAVAVADPVPAAKQRADAVAVPDAGVVQATYDFELRGGNPAHDKGLKILLAKCMNGPGAAAYICFVSFYSQEDPGQRIYNSAIEIARIGDGWFLKSGLCKNTGDQAGTRSAY
jgi:hypothetical protein